MFTDTYSQNAKIYLERGPRYARIVCEERPDQRSTKGFIEIATGNLLKAAGWKSPAKGIRGNVSNLEAAMTRLSVYGGIK